VRLKEEDENENDIKKNEITTSVLL